MGTRYAISDIHGMYDVYEKVCDLLTPDDKVYFLGDAGDRGYDGFRCIKAIYENPQWIYLKGNHEDFFATALGDAEPGDLNLWMYNGGRGTLDGWMKDGEDPKWPERLKELPLIAEYTNDMGITFIITHAGYTLGYEVSEDDLLWSRNHFYDTWDEEKYPNHICIHGHTPIEYLVRYLRYKDPGTASYYVGVPEARNYCNGHKICIDNGVFYTKSTVLYNLDTMQTIPIYSDADFEW